MILLLCRKRQKEKERVDFRTTKLEYARTQHSNRFFLFEKGIKKRGVHALRALMYAGALILFKLEMLGAKKTKKPPKTAVGLVPTGVVEVVVMAGPEYRTFMVTS